MTSFIQDVIVDLQKKEVDISQLTFILPSKRAGIFLTHILSQTSKKTQFAPDVFSIEEFVETLSDLKYCSNTELLFEFYEVYLKITPKEEVESFDKFKTDGIAEVFSEVSPIQDFTGNKFKLNLLISFQNGLSFYFKTLMRLIVI